MKDFLAILCALCACHCQHAPAKQSLTEVVGLPQSVIQDTVICPGEMREMQAKSIPANLFAPRNRRLTCGDYGWYMPDDTVTPKGNFVKYLISNDTCCREYLYLNWGNAKFHRTENLGELRQFHPKTNPRYTGETDQYLFLEGAANGGFPITGWLLWAFPLASKEEDYQLYSTLDQDAYDLKSMTLLREVEKNTTDNLVIEAYNMRTKRIKPIHLPKQIRKNASSDWSIDSISVTPRTIFLQLGGYDKQGKEVKETLLLPNDIK